MVRPTSDERTGIRIEVTPSRDEIETLFRNRGLLPDHYEVSGMLTQILTLELQPKKGETLGVDE